MRQGPRAGWLLVLLFACASPGGGRDGGPTPTPAAAPAADEPRGSGFRLFPHDPDLSAFVQSYPRAPDPEAAIDRLFALDLARFEAGAREREQWPLARGLLIEFYATLIREQHARAAALAHRASVQGSAEKVAFCQEVLARAAEDPVEVEFPLEHAAGLDLLWARYYASGDREHVRQIARALEYALPADEAQRRVQELARSKPEPGTPVYAEIQRILVPSAAVYGLKRHGAVDPGVRAVLRELAREPGHVGEVSASIVSQLEIPYVPTWEPSSSFQAVALLTDDPEGFVAKWISHSAPLPLTNHASHGNVVHVIILFSNCAAGVDGLCRVVADFQVTAPDGSIYARTEMQVWVGRPPPAERSVHFGTESFGLMLPSQAKPGRYVIHVSVRDEVADQALSSTLDLFLEESS